MDVQHPAGPADDALSESERQFRTLAESIPQLVWMAEPDGYLTWYNRRWYEYTGTTPDEMAGWGWQSVHDPEMLPQVLERWRAAIATGRPFEMEFPLRGADGRFRWFLTRVTPVTDADGKVLRWFGTNTDIDALRTEAELVRTMERFGSALTAQLDLHRIVQMVTDEATRLTGAQFGAFFYNALDQSGESYLLYTLSGAPREAFASFPMPRNTAIFEPTFRGTGVVRSDDITRDPRYGRNAPYHGMPKGHLPVVSYLAVSVIGHSGDVIGGLFFGHERPAVFTERHERLVVGIAGWAAVAVDNARLYEAERRARAEAETANRAKSDFLAVMSHELRTPLNAIAGYVQLLDMGVHGPLCDPQRDVLARIDRNQRHLLRLINDILNLSRIEAGRVEYRIEDVSLLDVVADLSPLIEMQLSAKGLAYTIAVAPDAIVRADRDKVAQIVLNVLTNAVKFTPAGGTVSVEAMRDDATPEVVALRVRDSGIGIAPEQLAAIFEPFVQVDVGHTRTTEGTGLGLAISRDLARGMSGDLTVESAVGAGSTFTLILPRGGANSPAAVRAMMA